MTAERVMDELMELRRTVGRLHEPHIIAVEVGDYRPARIHLHVTGDPTEIIQDIGLGLIDKDEESDPEWDYFSITDTNGVEVYWLKMKAAPEAGTSEAAEKGEIVQESLSPSIIGDSEKDVKEAES